MSSLQQQRRKTKEIPLICLAIILMSLELVAGFKTYYMDHEVTEQQAKRALPAAFNSTVQGEFNPASNANNGNHSESPHFRRKTELVQPLYGRNQQLLPQPLSYPGPLLL